MWVSSLAPAQEVSIDLLIGVDAKTLKGKDIPMVVSPLDCSVGICEEKPRFSKERGQGTQRDERIARGDGNGTYQMLLPES